ncbi:HET-domain-containing protein, partial [Pyrenochaeta sp. DS3sAY3a]
MLLLKGWLDHCVENHHCQHLTKTPVMQVPWFHQLPARILDVSCFDDSEDVRLAETAFLDPKLPYIALSHVWGPNGIPDHTKLLKSNITQFHKRIPYSCLAKNFQDAINITRQLKLRYIWIDAICIIQDSTQDWKTESMKMASVYMNALLTVAIEDSPDSEGGCFRTVDFSKSLPTMISIESTLSNGVTSTLIIPEEVDATVGGTVETGPPELQRSVLATRAWAYQERILSPRIIHFTNDTMIWECRTHYQGLWNILTRDTCNGNFSDCNRTSLLSRWYNEVVLEYSGRRLTHDEDKLPALAGLARLFHQLLGMPYHAGI